MYVCNIAEMREKLGDLTGAYEAATTDGTHDPLHPFDASVCDRIASRHFARDAGL